MPPEEALAVVAHEYGHLAGSHGRFGAWIYRLRHTWGTIQAHAEQLQGWLGRAVLPLVRWYAPYFNAYTFVLARANEYEADAASAELVGARVAARALKRVNLVAPRHEAFIGQAFERIADEAAPPRDLAQRWAQQALLAPPADDAQAWLAAALDREGAVDDTHPVLRARLAALPVPGEDAQALPPAPAGPTAAEAWLGPLLPVLREKFQQAWAAQVAEPWSERHEQVQQRRQRLALLRAHPEHSRDEALELLQLRTDLERDADLRDDWAAYNTLHPEHAVALYFEGAERLHHDDAAGLPLLERAIALDVDFTKPAAERAHAYFQKHKDKTAAEAWAERWRRRDAFETQRRQEIDNLDPTHRLLAPELDATTLQQLRALLDKRVLQDVAQVHLARREIPSDPGVQTYVLGVTLTWWGRRRGRQQAVVDRLAALEWPLHLFVCTLEGRYAKLARPLKALAGSQLI